MRRVPSKRLAEKAAVQPRRGFKYHLGLTETQSRKKACVREQRPISREALGRALAHELRHGGDGIAYLHAALLLRRLARIDAEVRRTFALVLEDLDSE